MKAKVAIVTGASSGIGLALVRSLIERRWNVVAVARGASTKGTLSPADNLALIDGDVSHPSTAERAVETARRRFGAVDLLVNNAGIFSAKPFTEYSPKDFDELVSTNVAGFWSMSRAVVPAMIEQRRGHIVSVSTSLVAQPIGGVPAAVPIMTKGAIEAGSRALAIELAPHAIRVNVVSPGIIDTPMHNPDHHKMLATLSPAGRIGSVSDATDAILFLDGASFVSGEVVHVDGGAHAGRWS